ncbi:MAG TPA: response regulator [Gemmatimonadales bacterium]
MTRDDPAQPPVGHGETILVTEDTDNLRAMLAEMLVGLGYKVLQAASVSAALAVLADQKVDLLLSDVVMGGQTGGIELARAARAIDPNMRIVLMSGYMEHFLPRAHSEVCDAILMKPYRRHELASRLRELLDTRVS